jgi:hypothetical protein
MADAGLFCKWTDSDTVMDSETTDRNVPIQVEKNEDFPSNRHGPNLMVDSLCNKIFRLEWNRRDAVLHLHLKP